MAKTAEGRAITEAHRLQQLGVRAQAIRDLARLWPMWSSADPATFDSFVTALAIILQNSREQAALIAARYYRAFRAAEGIPGEAAIVLAKPLPRAAVEASLGATAQAGRTQALAAGMKEAQAAANGFVRLSGSMGRHVLNAGRETIVETGRRDPYALGWARVTDGQPCSFCAMLASRGPVYWSDDTAGFQAHDHDGCSAEPHYEGSAWPGGGTAQAFRAQWNELTKGLSGAEARNAFRQGFKP